MYFTIDGRDCFMRFTGVGVRPIEIRECGQYLQFVYEYYKGEPSYYAYHHKNELKKIKGDDGCNVQR